MNHEESPSPAPPFGQRISPRLVALNVALLATLVVVTITGSRPATAQPPAPGSPAAQPARGRGDYTMVCGKYSGATSSAVYIIDAANQELVVLGWDRASARLTPIGHRSLIDDGHYLTKPR